MLSSKTTKRLFIGVARRAQHHTTTTDCTKGKCGKVGIGASAKSYNCSKEGQF
jgi:hypothetical protein